MKHKSNKGYGKLTVNKKGVYAHRLAFKLSGKKIKEGQFVLHHCDNPACINPKHLYAGNQIDNMKDCVKRGRHGGPPPPMKGNKNPAAKLNDGDIKEIKQMIKEGNTQSKIAKKFNVCQSQISNIKRGIQWKNK